ncbi:MAG: hypothetical protein HC786_32230 [Richelia sp. CSU_2_1]|nr:hypothetical protein [Richelia sp. CSU_2_1]
MSFELKIESGSIGVSIQLSAISRQLKTHLYSAIVPDRILDRDRGDRTLHHSNNAAS